MTTSTPIKVVIALVITLTAFVNKTMAQAEPDPLLFNDGAMFYINGDASDSAIVFVDGVVMNNDSIMVNLGKFIIKGDFINNGQSGGFDLFPLNIEPNDGLFEVYGDWENNGIYNAGQGRVKFMTTDSIQGTVPTTFHNVDLIGDIRRIQDGVNARINETGVVKLNIGEWATDFDTLWVDNPATGAMQRNASCDTCGYVSSLDDGNLARVVNQAAVYNFPTGSGLDVSPNQFERYRPVTIEPETADVDTFHVRFVNRNATINGLPLTNVDTTICYANPWWYHRINKRGGDMATADLGIYANFWENDEDYNAIARWTTANTRWENLGNSASAFLGNFDQVVHYGWDDFPLHEDDAYIMAFNIPEEPDVFGDTALCASVPTVYNVPDNGSEYDFAVTGGTVVDETDYSVTVIWSNDSLAAVNGTIEVIETVPNNINGGCVSRTQLVDIEIWPLPVANFSVGTDSTLPGGIFVYDILEMQDSSLLTSEWYWDFGDGSTSTDSLPFHTYNDIGEYEITLVVRSGLECLDTLVVPVSVIEGLIVPNVFTPNNDGWNDVFDVRTSDVGPFKIEIYNRWGNVVFETTSPEISWDGTTAAGTQASSGTYFYVISKAEVNSGAAINNELDNFNFKETGWVQLIR